MFKYGLALVIVMLAASAQASTLSIESVRVMPAGHAAMISSELGSAAVEEQPIPPLMRPNPPTTYYDWYWQWRYIWMGALPIRYERYPTLLVSSEIPTKGLDRLVLGAVDYPDAPHPASDSADIALVAEAPNDEILGDGIFSVRFMLASGDRVGDNLNIRATLGNSILRATVPRLGRDLVLIFDCVTVENEGIVRPLTVTVSAKGSRGATSSSALLVHSSMLAMKRIDAAKKKLSGVNERISRQRTRGALVSDFEALSSIIATSIQSAEKNLYERQLLQSLAEIAKAEAKLDALARQVQSW